MGNRRKVLVFKINGEEFAADIMQVERILGFTEPVKVPESPDFVKGVIKYQEKVIPVIDLCKRLNISETTIKSDPKIVIVKHDSKSIGMIVDMVSEVIDIEDENIDNTPDIVRGISNKYINGMIKLNDRIIIFINTEKILTKEQVVELESITE